MLISFHKDLLYVWYKPTMILYIEHETISKTRSLHWKRLQSSVENCIKPGTGSRYYFLCCTNNGIKRRYWQSWKTILVVSSLPISLPVLSWTFSVLRSKRRSLQFRPISPQASQSASWASASQLQHPVVVDSLSSQHPSSTQGISFRFGKLQADMALEVCLTFFPLKYLIFSF